MASVKVCARFRPPNSIERSKGQDQVVCQVSEDHIGVQIQSGHGSSKRKTFVFDRVFDIDSSQEEVYQYTGYPLVEEVMQGFNVTMFAYGQTGSGKTFTMEGCEDMQGIIPRMVEHLFEMILDCEENTLEFLVRVSYVEIYNEKIRDLLEPSNQDLRVREHREKGVYIDEASRPYVGSPEEVLQLMAQGHLNRAVTSTGMNAQSSRSHAVFMLSIEQRNTETDAKKTSKIMLVDLAGSEKVRKTGATGSTMKEAQNINRSLSCLGMVINSLTSAKGHIPYRDSKLTRILSDSLGGNSKTCIIVTASPCIYNVEETISTMRFGQNCKRVKNKPKVNQELSVGEYKKIVAGLQRKIENLEKDNAVLSSQVNALKNAILSGDGDVDLESILAEATAESGVKMPDDRARDISNQPPNSNGDMEQQLCEMEEVKDKLEDELQDVRNELEIAESQRDALRDEIVDVQSTMREVENKFNKLKNSANQLKFYREKVEYMEKEHKMEVEDYKKRLKDSRRKLEESHGVSASARFDDDGEDELEEIEMEINTDQPVPYGLFERFKEQQERKHGKIIANLNKQLEEAQNYREQQDDMREIENLSELSSDERAQTVHKLLTEKQEIRRKYTEMQAQNEKYAQQMKAFAQREQYNDKLRRNWQTQLRQMEQALLLSNQINNQNRAKYQQTITEKDTEIAKLRAYVTHQLHRQRTMRRGTRIAKPISSRSRNDDGPKKIVGRKSGRN